MPPPTTTLRAAGFPLRTVVETPPETDKDAEFLHGRLLVADFVLMGIWKISSSATPSTTCTRRSTSR